MSDLRWAIADTAFLARERVAEGLFGGKWAPHAVAVFRILLGLSTLGLLLTNFASRGASAGQGSVWVEQARALSAFPEVRVLADVSPDVLTIIYILVILAAFAFTLGWRAKAANVLLVVGFIGIMGQNPVTAMQADNLIRLALLWALLLDTAEVWSLDARRRLLHDRDRRIFPGWFSTSMHNIGLIGLGAQVVLVYLSAGLHKIANPAWRDGSALAYTLRLPDYRAVPVLADVFAKTAVLTALLTFAVLLIQLYFAPLLLNRYSRVVVVVAAIAMNVFFAVVFALPWESLAIIAVTFIFMPDDMVLNGFERMRYSRLGDRIAEAYYTVADKVVYDWGYGISDAFKYNVWYPITDRFRRP